MPAIVRIAIAIGLAAAGVLMGPNVGPAGACSCAEFDEVDAFERADAVFVGEVLDYEAPPRGEVMSSADPATWTFGVSEVFKGEVTAVQEIVSEVSGASCGLEIPRQGQFLVFANADSTFVSAGEGQYHSGLCSGTRLASDGPLAVEVAGTPPIPMPDTGPAATVETSDGAGRSAWPLVAAAGAAMAGGVVLLRHRRSA